MTYPFKQEKLANILLSLGYVDSQQLDAALKEGEEHLAETLLRRELITEEHLAEATARQFHLTYVDLADFVVPPRLFEIISAEHAYRHEVVPYADNNGVLQVVVSDPFDLTLLEKLETLTGRRVDLLLSSRRAITSVLERSRGASEVLKGVSDTFKLVRTSAGTDGSEQVVGLDASLFKDQDDGGSVIKLVNTVLMDALQKRASDIHVETYEGGVLVKYRIDGVLYSAMEALDRHHHGALVSRLKIMAELDIAEKRVPQDGRFKLRFRGRDIDFRVSVLPGIFGEDVVIRILDKTSITDGIARLSLDSLGIKSEVVKKLRKVIREPYGMVLITGPTGSGKTTTLYAALSELDAEQEKIITIEDPVEYQLNNIVQIPVNEKKHLTFAKGLRSILRHDPDKIMVGEIRDKETVQIAVQSALTGHLVFTTVHANNAFDVVGRFSHMGVDVYSFVSALNCVMAQRLVRKLCSHCKKETTLDRELLELSGLDPETCSTSTWHDAEGCPECNHTGFRGRTAITELLVFSPQIRELVINRAAISTLQTAAKEEGMVTLRQSAVALAKAGITTLAEINRVTFVD